MSYLKNINVNLVKHLNGVKPKLIKGLLKPIIESTYYNMSDIITRIALNGRYRFLKVILFIS